jgi:hypothetical protein
MGREVEVLSSVVVAEAAPAEAVPRAAIAGRLRRTVALADGREGTWTLVAPQEGFTAEHAERAEIQGLRFARSAIVLPSLRALRALRWILRSRGCSEAAPDCALPPTQTPEPHARHDADMAVGGAHGFRRLVGAALTSLLLYGVLFGAVLDRPLELGFLAGEVGAKLARAATIDGPKLVILAGSNAPYSHRCQVIEAMLELPCVNGGVAVGIGLDYLFMRWRNELHPGDVVYLPMEQQQYTMGRSATELGPDATIMFRHDWTTLAALPPRRWLAAFFAFDLRAGLMSLIEMGLVAAHFHDPRAAAEGTNDAWGDHVGHSVERGAGSQGSIAAMVAQPVSASAVRDGYGASLIGGFVAWARGHGVRVIGGLPTEVDTIPLPEATRVAIASVYLARGGEFLTLANHSRYPIGDFFDTPLHLNEACQITHSILLARALAALLGRTALAPPDNLLADQSIDPVAGREDDPPAQCPGAATVTALGRAPH